MLNLTFAFYITMTACNRELLDRTAGSINRHATARTLAHKFIINDCVEPSSSVTEGIASRLGWPVIAGATASDSKAGDRLLASHAAAAAHLASIAASL